ncbi:MAG: tryptophan-rich sensory protein [Sphingomonas sp.]|nr:tryptophan-rich sensory protein [Sphingomonas sp.]
MDNWPIFAAMGWALALGVVGGALTPLGPWYFNLKKPAWQPPDWLFGPAWTLILGLAGWSAANAWYAAESDSARRAVVFLFAVNGLCHLLWSPLFFKLRRPDWALVEVVFLWGSLVAMIVGLWPISILSSLLILPYFAWVSFAAVLNRAIVRLNGPFGH